MGASTSKVDDEARAAIARYTELTRDDILAWEQRFTQQCDPGSTTMNKEQFCKFYQALRPTENVKRLSENVFRAFDLNGDHGISFSEVSRGLSPARWPCLSSEQNKSKLHFRTRSLEADQSRRCRARGRENELLIRGTPAMFITGIGSESSSRVC